MLLWQNWTPGLFTTGGTVIGGNPNPPYSIGGLLSLDPTSGTLTVTLPTLPSSGYSGWALRLEATMEGVSPNAEPVAYTPANVALSPSVHNCTTYFEDADWGNFVSYSGANVTATTRLNGAYGPGSFQLNILTGGVLIMNQYQTPLNRKIHLLVDLVAY